MNICPVRKTENDLKPENKREINADMTDLNFTEEKSDIIDGKVWP